MKDIFHFVEEPHNLRNNSTLKRKRNRPVYLGAETISYLVPKIWELVPNAIKNATSLELLKNNLSFGQQINVLVGFVRYT